MILHEQNLKKTLTLICLCLFVFVNPLLAQNEIWRGFVSYPNGTLEPKELTCDIVKNGELHIAPNLSEQSNYWSNFRYWDTICLSSNFSLEVRLKNTASDGGIGGFDSKIDLFSNGLNTSVALVGSASAQANTLIKIGDSTCVSNEPNLITNLSDWRIVKLQFSNNVFIVFLDGVEIYKTNHTRKICNLDILKFSFYGGGKVDWVKVYDNYNQVFWSEDFTDCNTLTRGIICDPLRLDKSISISHPCENDTLSLIANFPAMTYRWSTPSAKMDTNKIAKIIKPTSGFYDLTANVNACFEFSKSFEVPIAPITITKNDIRLCVGQTFTMPNGKIINADGNYRDTLNAKMGCDSIIVFNVAFETPPLSKTIVSICSNTYTLPSGKIVSTSGIYRDTTKNANGCLSFHEITVNTNIKTGRTISVKLCEGQSYLLPNGKNATTSGTYLDTLKSYIGCDSIVTTQLVITPKPKIKFELSNTGELYEGDNVTIRGTSENGIYSWFENTQPIPRNNADISIIVKGGETVYKLVLNIAGCETKDSVKIVGLSEIKLPNAFTPNNDKLNDVFSIVSKSQRLYKIIKFNIYNRQGGLVFTNADRTNAWDGTYNGVELASDSYIYSILVESPAGKSLTFNGEVVLLR